MKCRIKTFVAVTALAFTASTSVTAEACDRGGRRSFTRGPLSLSVMNRVHPSKRIYSQPVYSQRVVYSQPLPSASCPQVVSPSAPVTSAPVQPAPVSPAATPVNLQSAKIDASVSRPPQPTATTPSGQPANSSASRAENSALQLLASIATSDSNTSDSDTSSAPQIPQFAPASDSKQAPHIGSWSVQLPGSQSVALILNADGSFVWTATKDGKSSKFEGRYRLENRRLTLVRSNDLQQMAGTWTESGKGFTFKLDGASNGGLDFSRS